MKLAIMQPYLFPYIGYFQLISAVDTFVIYDDVKFIKGGWINRNRILLNGEPKYITLPVHKDAYGFPINQRHFRPGQRFTEDKAAILRQIEAAYRRAQHYRETLELVHKCFECQDTNVAAFVFHSIRLVCEYLHISTPLMSSAALNQDSRLSGPARVLSINKLLGATEYINSAGGITLYDRNYFAENGVTLKFIRPQEIVYPQFQMPFVPWLSIIDVLMFNSLNAARQLLKKFGLE